MRWKRYRLWRKDGTYEVGVGKTRAEAIGFAIGKGRIRRKSIKKVTLASK